MKDPRLKGALCWAGALVLVDTFLCPGTFACPVGLFVVISLFLRAMFGNEDANTHFRDRQACINLAAVVLVFHRCSLTLGFTAGFSRLIFLRSSSGKSSARIFVP